jgi:hypothetical protein
MRSAPEEEDTFSKVRGLVCVLYTVSINQLLNKVG